MSEHIPEPLTLPYKETGLAYLEGQSSVMVLGLGTLGTELDKNRPSSSLS